MTNQGFEERRVLEPGEDEQRVSAKASRASRKSVNSVLVVLFAVAICAGCGVAWWFASQVPANESGAYLIPKGSMTDDEARALLDEMAEKSRITVSLAPYMTLRDDGSLRVNLVVPDPNNGLSERLEVEQDGHVVLKSGIVDPGFQLEWGSAQGAHLGAATATVFAVSEGADTGNPVSVEVEIVEPGFKADQQVGREDGSAEAAGVREGEADQAADGGEEDAVS